MRTFGRLLWLCWMLACAGIFGWSVTGVQDRDVAFALIALAGILSATIMTIPGSDAMCPFCQGLRKRKLIYTVTRKMGAPPHG